MVRRKSKNPKRILAKGIWRMKYLITGANGQLAKEFIKTLDRKKDNYTALTKEQLNIADINQVLEIVRYHRPDIIINCAAYNQVDKAEEEFEEAIKVNHQGVMNLSIASQDTNSLLIHYSTDYVFDGKKEGKYTEEDKPNPLSRYALSKYLGEIAVKTATDKHLIFRVSWVYGEGKQNFLYKLTQWAEKNEHLKIACDEFSVPTSTRTIVDITLKAIDKGLTGLYHLTNSGYASRYEWAKEYFKIKGIKKFIYPVYQSDFNLPAKRPRWSVMSNGKIVNELGVDINSWQEELVDVIK